MAAPFKSIFQKTLALAEGKEPPAQEKEQWVRVAWRDEIPLGCKVKTLKIPVSTYNYGGKAHVYLNKPATTVSYLPGVELIKLRFDDGALFNWVFKDIVIQPHNRKQLKFKPTTHKKRINLAARGPGLPETKLLTITEEERRPPRKKTPEQEPSPDPIVPPDEDLAALPDEILKTAIEDGGWVEETDLRTNRKYWWNKSTRERTWDVSKTLDIEEAPPPVAIPDKMIATSEFPTHDTPPVDIDGIFSKCVDRTVNEHPLWENHEKRCWLFSTVDGRWAMTDHDPKPSEDEERFLAHASTKHNGKLPTEMGEQWVIGDEEYCQISFGRVKTDAVMFLFDVFYDRHAPENSGKAAKLVQSITAGTHTLQAVVEKLCSHYHIEDSAWTGNPPKELIRHRVSEYVKRNNVSSASWLHVDAIVARATTPEALDREMINICKKSGGDPAEWIGDYPTALREPTPSEDRIRFNLAGMLRAAGSDEVERLDEAVERVLHDGERFSSVMTQNAVELDLDWREWRALTPIHIVNWTVSTFFGIYDPSGTGGETEPIAEAVSNGKYTLDTVMQQLCKNWKDRGADEAEWTGDYPMAMRPGYTVTRKAPVVVPIPPAAVLKTQKTSGPRGPAVSDMKLAMLGNKFRLFAFENMHKKELETVPSAPTDHLQLAIRQANTPEDLTTRIDRTLQSYLNQCKIDGAHHYLWLGSEPPALVRFRFDCLLGPNKGRFGSVRDETIHKIARKEITVDEGTAMLCKLTGREESEWVGPFPKALLKTYELLGDRNDDEETVSTMAGPTPPITTTPTPPAELPPQMHAHGNKLLSLSEKLEAPASKSPQSVRFSTKAPSVGSVGNVERTLFDAAVFRLNVFHEACGLPFNAIPTYMDMVTHGANPELQLDNIMMQLCVANKVVDVEAWCGGKPRAVFTYRVDDFFDRHDPPSGYQTPHLVDIACSPNSSIDAVIRELCVAYRLNPSPYLGDFPDILRSQPPSSLPTEREPIVTIVPSYNTLDHLRSPHRTVPERTTPWRPVSTQSEQLPFHML
eukprot:TRINITY_DN1416_c2_g1_i1.p1 TRINITY_DN1416_c2_g1~~TRINITY_DN1416_c2_g1_i1.p1  ORF type:complete len:1031 (+),score=165.03 TRINITY_DN1416_c2_g1_i1:178-3270(+)